MQFKISSWFYTHVFFSRTLNSQRAPHMALVVKTHRKRGEMGSAPEGSQPTPVFLLPESHGQRSLTSHNP